MQQKAYLVYYAPGSPCADHGRDWMIEDFEGAGIQVDQIPHWEGYEDQTVIVAGLSAYSYIAKLLREENITPQGKPEGVILQWARFGKQKLLVAAGTDAKGLMYALSELGDAVRCGGQEALRMVENTHEYPDLTIRGADRFIMGPRDDDWYYSKSFWKEHIRKLARCRFNRFTFIVGNDTWYMTPPYPFFIETPGYEQVNVIGQTRQRREATLDILQTMSRLCFEYGLEFVFSSWQQLPWTDNQTLRVENIPTTDDGFTAYAAKSIQALLERCPHIDGVQFRYNMEAGVNAKMPKDIRKGAKLVEGVNGAKTFIDGVIHERDGHETHNTFWYRMIDAIASVGRHIKIDMRLKGLTDDLIAYVLKSGLEPILATKYWCEHMGSAYPFTLQREEERYSIAQFGYNDYNSLRRYSFDNLLKKPHAYDMLYRLWNYGSAVLFLWGDPEYVRRFSLSCEAVHGTGFTFTEPLALKGGQAIIPGDAWKVHADERMRTYKWEDDRYWMFYLCFGRIGYSRATKANVWQREFTVRFGNAAAAAERVYRYGSRVIPLITTAHFPRHPSQHYWPELFPGNSLFKENNYVEYNNMFSYATSHPSDEQLYTTIDKAVDAYLAKKPVDAIHPLTIRDWYETLAAQIDIAIAEAENMGAADVAEWFPTKADFSMLGGIARYHVWMVLAAWNNNLAEKTGDGQALQQAYQAMLTARHYWSRVSDLGTKYYARNLMFDIGTGMRRNGNWADRLAGQIDKDIATLACKMSQLGILPEGNAAPLPFISMAQPVLGVQDLCFHVPKIALANQAIQLAVQDSDMSAFTEMKVYYRHINQREEYLSLPMQRAGDAWYAQIPAEYVEYAWDMAVYFVGHTFDGNGVVLPGMYSRHSDFPYFVVRIEQ